MIVTIILKRCIKPLLSPASWIRVRGTYRFPIVEPFGSLLSKVSCYVAELICKA
jgi:hypothetical protein